jgi:transcriptional regulator with XRE-family HTH domain
MAGRPKVLTPQASPRDRFGAELRRWREHRGLSQCRLAELVLHSEETVAKVERAQRWPTSALTARCDEALATEGALMRLWPEVEEQRIASDGRRLRRDARNGRT